MRLCLSVLFCLVLCGCGPTVKLFTDNTEPLMEYTLQGRGDDRIAMISLNGILTNQGQSGMLRQFPSPVQEVVSQLDLAAADSKVKAVVLKVNSPGGTVTASDILYKELMTFKKRTGKPLVVVMMDVAASGGYYVALPADRIVAHPTTITGSIGVIFSRVQLSEGMEKLGIDVAVSKSGVNKDMGSPFRASTKEEDALFQAMIDQMAERFTTLVNTHRTLTKESQADAFSARVILADEALTLGLIDQVGYIHDAIGSAHGLAGLGKDFRVVVYRRSDYKNDNVYNSAVNQAEETGLSLNRPPLPLPAVKSGFYYLWPGYQGF